MIPQSANVNQKAWDQLCWFAGFLFWLGFSYAEYLNDLKKTDFVPDASPSNN